MASTAGANLTAGSDRSHCSFGLEVSCRAGMEPQAGGETSRTPAAPPPDQTRCKPRANPVQTRTGTGFAQGLISQCSGFGAAQERENLPGRSSPSTRTQRAGLERVGGLGVSRNQAHLRDARLEVSIDADRELNVLADHGEVFGRGLIRPALDDEHVLLGEDRQADQLEHGPLVLAHHAHRNELRMRVDTHAVRLQNLNWHVLQGLAHGTRDVRRRRFHTEYLLRKRAEFVRNWTVKGSCSSVEFKGRGIAAAVGSDFPGQEFLEDAAHR
jgi:hypothetical protein